MRPRRPRGKRGDRCQGAEGGRAGRAAAVGGHRSAAHHQRGRPHGHEPPEDVLLRQNTGGVIFRIYSTELRVGCVSLIRVQKEPGRVIMQPSLHLLAENRTALYKGVRL